MVILLWKMVGETFTVDFFILPAFETQQLPAAVRQSYRKSSVWTEFERVQLSQPCSERWTEQKVWLLGSTEPWTEHQSGSDRFRFEPRFRTELGHHYMWWIWEIKSFQRKCFASLSSGHKNRCSYTRVSCRLVLFFSLLGWPSLALKNCTVLRFFTFFTDYTFLYHVTQPRVRLRSPFPFHYCTLVTHPDSFFPFLLCLTHMDS